MVDRRESIDRSAIETCEDEAEPRQPGLSTNSNAYTTTNVNNKSVSPLVVTNKTSGAQQLREVEVIKMPKVVTEEDLNELTKSMNAALIECMKDAETQRQQCKIYEEQVLNCNGKIVDLQNELDLAVKERDHFKKLSEEYHKKMNQQKEEFYEKEIAKISQLKPQEHDLSSFEEVWIDTTNP